MSNCRQIKSGSVSKRYGTVCVGTTNARLGGGTPPAAELLATYGTELVRVGFGHVDTCRVVGSTDCIYKGRASEAVVYRQTITSGESYIVDCDVAVGNGLTVYVCLSTVGIYLGVTSVSSVLYFVTDASGAVVVPRTVVASGLSGDVGRAHVVVIGTTAVITYVNTTGVFARTLNLSTLVLGAATSLVAGVNKYAVGAMSDRFALLYEGAAGMYVGTWTAALAVQTAAVNISAQTGTGAWAVEGVTGGTLYAGYTYSSAGSLYVKAMGLSPATLATTFALTTIESGATTDAGINLGIAINGGTAWYTWTRAGSTTGIAKWCDVTSAGVVGISRFTYQMGFASKPFIVGGLLYALAMNVHSTHASYFLVHLYDVTTPATSQGMRIVATVAPRQVPRYALSFASGVVSSVPLVSAGRYAIGAVVSGAIVDSFVASLLDVRLGATSPIAVQAGGLLVFSGGTPTAYDGSAVVELGMPWEPDFGQMSAAIVAGGSLTAGVYYYLVVYEWRFANGAVVRSIPSYPRAFSTVDAAGVAVPIASQGLLTVTAAGANLKGSITVADLNLTNKQAFSGAANGVSLVLYRTTVGGSTFYRASEIQIAQGSLNQVNNTTVVITDGVSDVDLRTRPAIYVTGGALPSEIPSSAAHVAVIGNRVWLSGTDDDAIWFSNELVDGEAPTFSGTLTFAPFEGGRVVGMAAMDEKKIILKADALFYVVGDGPGIDGLNGSFSHPARISSDVGCTDARSIVATPAGVLFLSQNGLALLGRDLAVTLVGKAVEDTVGTSLIAAASVVADQDVVRFALAGSAKVVEFDMFHGGAWGTNAYQDPVSANEEYAEAIVGATYCRGAWFYINALGHVFQETKSSWLDTSGATQRYVVQRAQLRYLSLGDLQGFARVWYVSVLGEFKANHDLTVRLRIDEQSSTVQTTTFTAATIAAWARYQAQVHVAQQECEALSVEVYDAYPTGAALTTGQGFTLLGVSAEVGLEKPIRRVTAAQTG